MPLCVLCLGTQRGSPSSLFPTLTSGNLLPKFTLLAEKDLTSGIYSESKYGQVVAYERIALDLNLLPWSSGGLCSLLCSGPAIEEEIVLTYWGRPLIIQTL